MANELHGRRIAILAARGVEEVELVEPRRAVTAAGAQAELLSIQPGETQAVKQDIYPTVRLPWSAWSRRRRWTTTTG
jgi:deglycase